VTAFIGPTGSGVVVATRDPERAWRDRVWLEAEGFAAATPADLGLELKNAGIATRQGEPEVVGWARAIRHPAVATEGERVFVESPAGSREVDRQAAPAAVAEALAAAAPRRAAVFGGAWTAEDHAEYEDARALGKALAEADVEVVCGGYQGVMAAICRGYVEDAGVHGGTIGVTIAPWSEQVPVNAWLSHEVEARDLFARLPVITDADAWVAFSGGVGTLKEVALCWNLVQTGSADPRPLVVVGDRWQALLDTLRERLILTRPEHLDLVHHVDDAESALPLLTG
jgi:uncharacterized protein (TIGR00730 family)